MRDRPPSEFARLRLFCELVDEYDELAAAFPVQQSRMPMDPEKPVSPAERWARVVRAMALRKFIVTKTDHVYVPKVFDAIEICSTDPQIPVHLLTLRHTFASLGNTIEVNEGKGESLGAARVIEDLIYGGLLHGDYGRHETNKERADLTVDLMLWQFTGDSEHLVRQLRSATRHAMDDGALVE